MEQPQTSRYGLLQGPYRLMFLFAAVHAALVPVVWLLPLEGLVSPAAFHSHELVYGTIWAMVGGYVLTALSSWNRTYKPSAAISVIAAALWLFDRLAPLAFDFVSSDLSFRIPSIFPLFLIICVALNLSGVWKLVPIAIVALMSAMALSSSCDTSGNGGAGAFCSASFRDVLLIAALVTVVGGRAVPAFANFWVADKQAGKAGSGDHWLEFAGLATFATGILGHVSGMETMAGLAFIMTAGILALRLIGWRWGIAITYPALLMLFLAWLWLPVGLLLVGLALFTGDTGEMPARMHALAIGAIGSMSYAMMARPCMKRSEGRLIPSAVTMLGYALIHLAALVRVFVAGHFGLYDAAIDVSAAAWILGWILFLVAYVPSLFRPAPKPVFSASHGSGNVRAGIGSVFPDTGPDPD